ncbi:MAG: ABC transporter ATP-binding protein [Candidatus Njordarchaeota archaeon]
MEGIKAENIKKSFLDQGKIVSILNGVSFSIPPKSNLAVIGPNGSGKTTLLKILATILAPDAGRAFIRGYDIMRDIDAVRKIISYINPELRLHERLTVKKTLKFFAAIQDVNWKSAKPYLEAFGMMHMIDSPVGALSTGQKAALRFTIGLMKTPEVLFLDEVFSGLDISRSEKLLEIVEHMLKEHGIDIVIVDHNPDLLDRLCDKVIILERGKPVSEIYSIKEILAKFDYKWDIIVTWLREVDEKVMKTLEETYGCRIIKIGQDRSRIFVKDEELVREIAHYLVTKAKNIIEINASPVTLKDLFLEVIMKK